MGWGSILAVPVVFLAVVAFWLNQPLPPNTANPIQYKIWVAILKGHDDWHHLKAWWTGEDYRIIQQQTVRQSSLASRLEDPQVLASEEKFAGVTVYVYQPKKTAKNRLGLMYFHGGGFRNLHPVNYESVLFKLVKALDIVIVAVDYRLTPSIKAPVPHEDCEKATQYFFLNAEKYGVDPNKIGAAGDSAGGNLASSLSLTLRDQQENQFIYQLLIYPWVQGLDMQTPSYQRNSPSAMPLMNHQSMTSYLGSFLGVPPRSFPDIMANKHVRPQVWNKYKKYFNLDEINKGSMPPDYKPVRPMEVNEALADFIEEDLTNPYLFPLLADDLSDLPPAYVLTVENDPLRDEGIWLANRLKRAGNKVLHDHNVDGFHGMMRFQGSPFDFTSANRATENMISFVKDVLSDLREDQDVKAKAARIDPMKKKSELKVEKDKIDDAEEMKMSKDAEVENSKIASTDDERTGASKEADLKVENVRMVDSNVEDSNIERPPTTERPPMSKGENTQTKLREDQKVEKVKVSRN